MKPKVSIIIPAYNAARFINETISSVLNQTYSNWELIIVNDGSNDHTLTIVNSFSKNDSRIIILDQNNSGVSTARNNGLDNAIGVYIAFLDADDIWEPNFLQKGIDLLDHNKNLGLVYSDLKVIDGSSKFTGELKIGKEGWILNEILASRGHIISPPSGILVRKLVVDEVGGFDVTLSNNADQEFYLRVANKFEIGKIDEVQLNYRVHDSNMHSNINVLEKDSLYVYRKAQKMGLFESRNFQRQCFANLYIILGTNFWVHMRRFDKLLFYFIRAIILYPYSLISILKKIA